VFVVCAPRRQKHNARHTRFFAKSTHKMIILEYHNRIVEEAIKTQVQKVASGQKADVIDITCADFDGVAFHIASDAKDANLVSVSISTRCYSSLGKYGVDKRLKAVYGELVTQPEGSYDATLRINLTKAPNTPGRGLFNVFFHFRAVLH
jgi:hypothetical protein